MNQNFVIYNTKLKRVFQMTNEQNEKILQLLSQWNEVLIYTLIRKSFRIICFTELTPLEDKFIFIKAIVKPHGIFHHIFKQTVPQCSRQRRIDQLKTIAEIINKETDFTISSTFSNVKSSAIIALKPSVPNFICSLPILIPSFLVSIIT